VRSRLLQNIAGSWLGIGADAVTGLILTRVILHSVGDASFGLWVLVSGLLGYYGLLDLGTRNAIIRYVARHNAQKDFDGLSKVVSTALAGYLAVGCAVLVIAGVAAWRLDHLFAFRSAQDLADGRALVLILGVGAAIGFPLNAFSGTLEGLQQFVRIGVVQSASTVCRAIVVVICLGRGYGIVAVGLVTVLFNVAAGVANAAFVVRRLTHVRFSFAGVSRETFVTLTAFGVVTFWVGIANRLRFESDSLVIGSVVGLQMVAVFAIGSRVLSYSTELVAAMSSVFTPILSHAHAVGDPATVTQMTLRGNRYSSLLAFPITVVLLFFGKLLIGLWVGPQYALSYTVLAIIAVPLAVYVSQGGSTRMLYGMGRHKALARLLLVEGAANLVLSVLLARKFGILGVAWGTTIPLACTAFVALPWLSCRSMGTSLSTYWRSAQLPALLMVAPLIALFGALTLLHPAPSVVEAAAELAVGGCLYAAMTIKQFRNQRGTIAPLDSESLQNG
jgi:O-antigen/teichoic acid export membrane protein